MGGGEEEQEEGGKGRREGERVRREKRERERTSKMVICLQSGLRSNITSLSPYSFRRESRGPAHSQRVSNAQSVDTRRSESLGAILETADSNCGLKTSP